MDKLRVRRQWNDHRTGKVSLDDISDLHWGNVSGGVRVSSPQSFIFGYVSCDMVEDDIAHSCLHGEGPHSIKVCVVKKDNSKEVWDEVNRLAGPNPPIRRRKG